MQRYSIGDKIILILLHFGDQDIWINAIAPEYQIPRNRHLLTASKQAMEAL